MGNMNVTVIDQNNVNIAVTPTPTQTINIDRGLLGPSGWSGYSGTSGFSGNSTSGYSGYSGAVGQSGYSGFSGQQGTSINVKGEVPTVEDLPPTGNQVNDAYIVTEDGNLWVWNGSAWYDAGQIVGPQGLSGYSGYSGDSTSGYSGYSGETVSGYSGYSGIGESGYSGFSGETVSGYSGYSGDSTSGFSGYSGETVSGYSGYSGESISGFSGYSGSGISGYSGSGISGFSGYSGETISGYSGYSGSGVSGFSGYSGSGVSGYSGYSGSGLSGFSGSGVSGFSGFSGSGVSGYSGYSGIATSGYSGYSGIGTSGYSGYSGAVGAGGTIGNWGSFWDTTTQTTTINTPTPITFNSYDLDNTGVSIGSPTSRIVFANSGTYSLTFSIQFTNTSTANGATQIWLKKNGTNIPDTNSHFDVPDKQGSAFSSEILTVNFVFNVTANDYVQLYWDTTNASVSLETIAGNGTYPRTPSVIFTATQVMYGQSGYSGISGYSGNSTSGYSGFSGYSGSGISGYSGSGISGYSGSGVSGFSGYSGSGLSGFSGYSGSGISGYSGSGVSGFSGFSGSGISGYSGIGTSGYSGYSGITPTIGGSNTQVQYNNSGVLGGSANLVWDNSNTRLGIATSSPIYTLDVNGDAKVTNAVRYYVGATQYGVSFANAGAVGTEAYQGTYIYWGTGSGASATEKMRITNTGLVGIGTSSPARILELKASQSCMVFNDNTNQWTIGTGSFIDGSDNFIFYKNAIGDLMRLTGSGNLGLGVTPSSWQTALGTRAIQFTSGAVLGYRDTNFLLTQNAYLDSTTGGWKYLASSIPAAYYDIGSGGFGWFQAPSGTAGNAISFTQAMTLDASGNLGVGETSPSSFGKLAVYGGSANTIVSIKTNSFEGTYYAGLNFSTGGQGANDPQAQIKAVGANNYSANLVFSTQQSGTTNPLVERMRIASNGDVTIGNAVASTNVNLILNGVTSKAQRIYFNTSGVDKWLLGQGAATETDAFEIYNANGQMALTFAKATSNATFGGNIIVSPVTTTNSAYLLNSNASGNFFFAIDSSTGASFTGTAYGRAIYSGGAYPMVFLTNDTERMRITSTGLVGIGTSSPVAPLNIVGQTTSTSTPILYLQQGGSAPNYGYAFKIDNQTTGNLLLNRYDNPNTDIGTLLTVLTTGQLAIGLATATGQVAIGSSTNKQLQLTYPTVASWYNSVNSGGNYVWDKDGSEKMRIDSSGNVGIGTSSPTSFGGFKTLELANSSGNAISLVTGTSVIAQTIASNTNSLVYTGSRSNHSLVFTTNDTERMRLDSSGNLLVGDTSLGTSYGAASGVIKQTGGVWTNRGQFSSTGGSTTTFLTLANASNNQSYIVSVRQSGAGGNFVSAFTIAYGSVSTSIRFAQDNLNPVLDMNITSSGLNLQLVLGSGFGNTTWDWVITRLG